MTGNSDQLKQIAFPSSETEIEKIVQKYSPAIVQKAFVRALEDGGDDLLRSCLTIVMSSYRRTNVSAADGAKALDSEVNCHDIFGDNLRKWSKVANVDISKIIGDAEKPAS